MNLTILFTEVKGATEQIYLSLSPLEANKVSLPVLLDVIEDAVDYSRRYLSLESTGYHNVWCALHICPDSHKWPNILLLYKLEFTLPFSDARVEQIFSCLKVIKTNSHPRLNTGTLDDLLEIYVEGPPYQDFPPDSALELWWKDT